MTDREDSDSTVARLLDNALEALEARSASDRVSLLADGRLERLVAAIAPRFPRNTGTSIYDYLLENKDGLTLLARLRHLIHLGYSVKGKLGETDVYVSPDIHQWHDNGVMFLQGLEPFVGNFGLYEGGKVKFAIAARAASEGETLTPDFFIFLDLEELSRRPRSSLVAEPPARQAISELESLLGSRTTEEQTYQGYFARFPWVLGGQHTSIQSHEALDDLNIPDFTGIRTRDGHRDIFEIKSPFLALVRNDGELAVAFNKAWNQTERYLDFCRRDSDYLRRKGLAFENPHCYLVLGYGLTYDQLRPIRAKERMNSAITVLTYDDVLTQAKGTVALLENLALHQRERA